MAINVVSKRPHTGLGKDILMCPVRIELVIVFMIPKEMLVSPVDQLVSLSHCFKQFNPQFHLPFPSLLIRVFICFLSPDKIAQSTERKGATGGFNTELQEREKSGSEEYSDAAGGGSGVGDKIY